MHIRRNLSRFMAACLGRKEEFTIGEMIVFYTAFIFIMSVLSYLQGF
jgi:hypothetical protein